MTMLAILGDVHADVHALRDALVQTDRLGVDRLICCGDLVDYGRFPEETIALIRERKIRCIRGNHDRWGFNGAGAGELSRHAIAFLDSLPTTLWLIVDGTRVAFYHARPRSDRNGIAHDAPERELVEQLDQADADILIVGHTHVPFARCVHDGRLVCNPGALLRDPAPGVTVATSGTFGILEVRQREFSVRTAARGEPVRARARE